MKDSYTQVELDEILSKTNRRKGWDFSVMNTWRAPVTWDYLEVVKKHLKPDMNVLDIGTGGGERFRELSSKFRHGVGTDIDPNMIKIATDNSLTIDNIEFKIASDKLEEIEESFDVILNRHAPYNLKAISNHLKRGGCFITQQVGERNMLNIKKVLSQEYVKPILTKEDVLKNGLSILYFQEYDVEYVVKDIESLIFWLKALDMLHADIATDRVIDNVETLNAILKGNVDERGFVTNEHRYLVVAGK